MSNWRGQTIGDYELAEEIGRGGAAVVYRAFQPQLERWVAIKLLEVKGSGGKQFVRRFRREARAIAALRHQNILNIHDYGEDKGCAYIVMEYVEKGPLSRHLTGQPLTLAAALALMISVGDALAYAHSQKIVHQDVKPSNILLMRADWPLLADFGLARVVGARQKLRAPDSVVGTMDYLSPEQAAGKSVDFRSDIYNLGIVLYELMTGRLPFAATTPYEALMARLDLPPIVPTSVNDKITHSLETVILKALAREPKARYANMATFVDAMRRVLERSQRVAVPITESKTTPMITTRMGAQPAVQGPQLFIATSGVALSIPLLAEVMIGRRNPLSSQIPDLDLDPFGGGSAGVSRQHARILRRDKGWFLEDLQSTNGTYVNEVRLLPRRPIQLRSGDLVRFGQMTLVFEE